MFTYVTEIKKKISKHSLIADYFLAIFSESALENLTAP
jgi:hypothetical protein